MSQVGAEAPQIFQRQATPPGLLTFVSPHKQRAFNKFLYSQFNAWEKEKRRTYYRARKFYRKKIDELIISYPSSVTFSASITSTQVIYDVTHDVESSLIQRKRKPKSQHVIPPTIPQLSYHATEAVKEFYAWQRTHPEQEAEFAYMTPFDIYNLSNTTQWRDYEENQKKFNWKELDEEMEKIKNVKPPPPRKSPSASKMNRRRSGKK